MPSHQSVHLNASQSQDLHHKLVRQEELAEFLSAVTRLAQEHKSGASFFDSLMPGIEAVAVLMSNEVNGLRNSLTYLAERASREH